jgi:hypothetical protein
MNRPDFIGLFGLLPIGTLVDRGAIGLLRIYQKIEVISVREDT